MSDNAPDLDLGAIRQRADAATNGPWITDEYDRGDMVAMVVADTKEFGWWADFGPAEDAEQRANAEFVAHARTDVPALLALVEAQAATHDAVRHLHRRDTNGHCYSCFGDYWPCRTRRALDGDAR